MNLTNFYFIFLSFYFRRLVIRVSMILYVIRKNNREFWKKYYYYNVFNTC